MEIIERLTSRHYGGLERPSKFVRCAMSCAECLLDALYGVNRLLQAHTCFEPMIPIVKMRDQTNHLLRQIRDL